MNSLKLSITDCTEWSRNSCAPGTQSDSAESAPISRIELGPIGALHQESPQTSVPAISALLSSIDDFDLVSKANINNISVLLSASDGHSIKLLQRNKMKQLRHIDALCEQARERQLPVRCYLMCAFTSSFDGQTSPHDLTELCARLIRFGCEDVILVDNDGNCKTKQLKAALNTLSPQLPKARTGFYFSADNPEAEALVQTARGQAFNKFCITRNGGLIIGSEKRSSMKLSELLINYHH